MSLTCPAGQNGEAGADTKHLVLQPHFPAELLQVASQTEMGSDHFTFSLSKAFNPDSSLFMSTEQAQMRGQTAMFHHRMMHD
jgi:hypothetical protein